MTTRRDFIKGLIAAGILPAIGQTEGESEPDVSFFANGIEIEPTAFAIKMKNLAYGTVTVIAAEFAHDPFPEDHRGDAVSGKAWEIAISVATPDACSMVYRMTPFSSGPVVVTWNNCKLTGVGVRPESTRYEWTYCPRVYAPYRLTATERKAERAQENA